MHRDRDRERWNLYPGYSYVGYAGYGFLDPFWDYSDGFDESAPSPDQTEAPYAAQWTDESQPYPAPSAEPYPAQSSGAAAAAPPAEEDAVTIVFKDGRPPEQIRNYALTRTALYIPGRRIREIPLDEIDLAATEKINREAGVEFLLPEAK